MTFHFFSDIHKQNINNAVSAFLPLGNILILSATTKARSQTVESGKQQGEKSYSKETNASESRLYFIILNGFLFVTITF